MSISPEKGLSPIPIEMLRSTRETDDTEKAAQSFISNGELLVGLAEKGLASGVDAEGLKRLVNEMSRLLAMYQWDKWTATQLYESYEAEKKSLFQEWGINNPSGELTEEEQQKLEEALQKELTEEEKKRVGEAIQLKLRAHRHSLRSLGPGAVMDSLTKEEKAQRSVDSEKAVEVERNLSSYLRVKVNKDDNTIDVQVTTERAADEIVTDLHKNPQKNMIVVTAPPGSGKTRLIDNLEILLRKQGWKVIQINFDKIIAAYFKREGTETAKWSELTSVEFDNSIYKLEQEVSLYYPEYFQGERVIVICDILGYELNNMLWGLGLVGRNLRRVINRGQAMVVSLIAQQAVVEVAKNRRMKGAIDPSQADKQLKASGGASAAAIVRHHKGLDDAVDQYKNRKNKKEAFQTVMENTDTSLIKDHVPEEELQHMVEWLTYFIFTREDLRINDNWWFAVNLEKPDEEMLVI